MPSYSCRKSTKMASPPRSIRDFLLEYDPKEGCSAPTEYAHLTMLGHLLSVISCWPLKIIDPLDTMAKRKRKVWVFIQRCFHLFVVLTSLAGGFLYLVLHTKTMTFFELGHLYISQLMSFVILSRIITLCLSEEYVDVARTFLEKMHLFYYKDRSEYSMKTHKEVHRLAHFFTIYLVGQMISGLVLFNITPMFNNFAAGKYAKGGLKGNDTYDHALYFSYPFNVSTDVKGYIVANFFHWIISYLTATWFCMHDCFLSLMVFHLRGHFKILLYNLENFPRPKNKTSFMIETSSETLTCDMYSESELKSVGKQLNDLIEYHRGIIDFTDKMSEVFGPMLFVYYGFHQTSGCLLLLECSQMTAAALSRYLPLTIILFQQLIQLSIIFELIGSISDRLKGAVYGLPWECMDTKNRRTVAFFLMNVQEPVHVKALGLADVGVTTMTTILKTSMSYFTFLSASAS